MGIEFRSASIRAMRLRQMGIAPPEDWGDVEQVRTVKKQEMGIQCTQTIYAGIEVGGRRYSLTDHDQTEIMAQLATVKEGAPAVPYHADGELCRLYPAAEFLAVATAAMGHIFWHRTYVNHLNAWIKRAGMDELEEIVYGAELPPDLKAAMDELLAAGDTYG